MTNETRKLKILYEQITETEKKKKGVDLLTFILMIATVVFAVLGGFNYALIFLLLTTLGLSTSNSLSTKIQILESDKIQDHLDSLLEDEQKKTK